MKKSFTKIIIALLTVSVFLSTLGTANTFAADNTIKLNRLNDTEKVTVEVPEQEDRKSVV